MLMPFSGVADVFMCPVDATGAKTGNFMPVGNAVPMSLKNSGDQIEVKSRLRSSANQVRASKPGEVDSTGSITLKDFNAFNLAWALSGEAVALSVTGSSVTDEAVTAVAAGKYAELAQEDVSSVAVQDVTDTTTYVEGTDYVLNASLGLISILSGGSISESDVLHIDYTYASQSGYQVNIGTEQQILVALKADVLNEFTGEAWKVNLDCVRLVSNAEVAFISESGSAGEDLQFTMTPITLDGQTSPGYVKGLTA